MEFPEYNFYGSPSVDYGLTNTLGDWTSTYGSPDFQWNPYDFSLTNTLDDWTSTYGSPSFQWNPYDNSSWMDSLGGVRGVTSLGLGGLSLLGNYLAQREQNQLGRDQLKAQSGLKQRELDTMRGMDLAKTDALMRLVRERQGVQALDPRRYAEIMASGMLPVEDIAPREIIDITAPAYAQGGSMDMGAEELYSGNVPMYNQGGLSRYVQGGSGGQEDDVNARLSHGEYVFDADSVAALGDGNNEAGARKLDQMRKKLRKHKRSAPADKIPPKAKDPMTYYKG